MNLCCGCGQDFGGLDAFDAHRVGKHAYLYDDEHPDGRRCLSVAEMEAKGFARTVRGLWSLSPYLQGRAGPQTATAERIGASPA